MKRFFGASLGMRRSKPGSGSSALEETAAQTPARIVLESFFAHKAAVLGLIVFVSIFVLTFVLSAIYPMDVSEQDVTQQDIPPGFTMAALPDAMKKNPRWLAAGSRFSVGADSQGQLHVWGHLTQRQRTLPEKAKDIVQVSAGLDHMLALDAQGRIYTWGNNRFGLERVPVEVASAGPMRQVVAGHQFSLAVSAAGELFFWGNGNLIELDAYSIPADLQGRVRSIAANSSNVLVLLEDGTLQTLGRQSSAISACPVDESPFVQLAAGDQAAVALTQDGRVVAWGNDFYGLLSVPPEIQGRTIGVSAGRFHFTALLEDGSVVAWGRNQLGQAQVPSALANGTTPITQLTSGYFLNYGVDSDGNVHPFGLKGYLMGTDGAGRDVFRRLISGGRLTLTVGGVAVLIAVVVGVLLGGLAGLYGGKTDLLLMRLAEIVGSIPFLPLAMTLSALIGHRLPETSRILLIMVILGALSWPGMARLVRGQILAEREKEFVLAARATGIPQHSVLLRYILPNILTPIVISATLSYASSMLTESALSFLGFGVTEPNATWGNMLMDCMSSQVLASYWWRWVFPAAALCLTTVSINLVGDGLRDAVDPHSARQ